MTTTAQIAAKSCQNTGLTEEHAKRLHDNLGRTILAVVELTADARTENRDGDEKVKLSIGMIEVVPEGDAAEHVRELARLFHYERQVAGGQPTLDVGDNEPTVEGVIAAGAAQRPHPFLPVDASQDNPLCDVCGLVETAPRHSTQDTLPDDDEDHDDELDVDAGEDEDSDDQADAGDEDDDWEYDQPEPHPVASTVGDPFTTPDPAA